MRTLPRWPTRHLAGAIGRPGGRGSVSVELAILFPAFALLIVTAIVAGRGETAYSAVAAAAHDAARAASISRDAATAGSHAQTVAATTLTRQGLHCTWLTVHVDTSQLARPPGQPATVSATVTCQVDLTDLGVGPGTTVEATFHSPVDVWTQVRGP